MNRRQFTTLLGVILVTSAPRVAMRAQEATPTSTQETTIRMTARKYQFEPPIVTVKQGARVKLVITAADHDHGFKLEAYNIDRKLPKGVATPVEFTADKAGTFSFNCSTFCGLGHSKMKGQLVVEAASATGSGSGSNP